MPAWIDINLNALDFFDGSVGLLCRPVRWSLQDVYMNSTCQTKNPTHYTAHLCTLMFLINRGIPINQTKYHFNNLCTTYINSHPTINWIHFTTVKNSKKVAYLYQYIVILVTAWCISVKCIFLSTIAFIHIKYLGCGCK